MCSYEFFTTHLLTNEVWYTFTVCEFFLVLACHSILKTHLCNYHFGLICQVISNFFSIELWSWHSFIHEQDMGIIGQEYVCKSWDFVIHMHTLMLNILIYKDTVPWPSYIYTFIKWTLMHWEHETHPHNINSAMILNEDLFLRYDVLQIRMS